MMVPNNVEQHILMSQGHLGHCRDTTAPAWVQTCVFLDHLGFLGVKRKHIGIAMVIARLPTTYHVGINPLNVGFLP